MQAIETDLVVQLDRSINHHTENTHMQMLQIHAAAVGWLLSPAHVSHVSGSCRFTRAKMATALRLQWQGCRWPSIGRNALAC